MLFASLTALSWHLLRQLAIDTPLLLLPPLPASTSKLHPQKCTLQC
jgi:hypothetical protein